MQPRTLMCCLAVTIAGAALTACGGSGSPPPLSTGSSPTAAAAAGTADASDTPANGPTALSSAATAPVPANATLCRSGGEYGCSGQEHVRITACTLDSARGSGTVTYVVTNPTGAPITFQTDAEFAYNQQGVGYVGTNENDSGTIAPGKSLTQTIADAPNAVRGNATVFCDLYYNETGSPSASTD